MNLLQVYEYKLWITQRTHVFELIGFGFGTDDCLQMSIQLAVSNAIKASNIKEDDISLILPNLCGEFLENERKYIADMFKNETPIFIAKQYLGECFFRFLY